MIKLFKKNGIFFVSYKEQAGIVEFSFPNLGSAFTYIKKHFEEGRG